MLSTHPRTPYLTKHCFRSAPSLLGDKTPEYIHLHLKPSGHLALTNPAPVVETNTVTVLQRWMRMRTSHQSPNFPQAKARESKGKDTPPLLLLPILLPPLLNLQRRLANQRVSLRKRKRRKRYLGCHSRRPGDPHSGGPTAHQNPGLTKTVSMVKRLGCESTKCQNENGRR